MQRKELKDDAVPTIWPNCPNHLSKTAPLPRTKLTSSSLRSKLDNDRELERLRKEDEQSKKSFCRDFFAETSIRGKYINTKCKMQNAKCKMQNAKCKMQNAKCKMQNAKCKMQNAKCLNGCSFKVYLSRISNATFNIKAKNIVSIANDISTTKREHADHKRSGIAKKENSVVLKH